VETLLGDPTMAKERLGWTPQFTVQQMCAEMVDADLTESRKCALLSKRGYPISLAAE
jgi:GDPmannose 4,6-dehydratase